MQKLIFGKLGLLILLISCAQPARSQVHIAPTVEVAGDYANGLFLSMGVGIRKAKLEIIPSFLLGNGKGGGLELRIYLKNPEAQRFQPFFALQQILFRRDNICNMTPCPATLYEIACDTVGCACARENFGILGSIGTGIQLIADEPWEGGFWVRIGGRYEF